MNPAMPEFQREEFDQLLEEHQRLIAQVNEVEFHLHTLSGGVSEEHVQALQQATGDLLALLRTYLFRQDQQVLPIVDALSRR